MISKRTNNDSTNQNSPQNTIQPLSQIKRRHAPERVQEGITGEKPKLTPL
jgi:hypothetical protein